MGTAGDAPMDALLDELRRTAKYQIALAGRVRSSHSGGCSRALQKDEEIASLKARLTRTQAELEVAL